MKVMVIVKASKDSEAGVLPSEQLLAKMTKYNQELVDAGIMQAGEGLKPSSTGVRMKFSGAERIVTDGPFAETKELIAGFWIWKVKDMDEAIAWLRRCPNPHNEDESEVEIRPIFSAEDFGDAMTPDLLEQEAAIRAQTLGLNAPRYEQGSAMQIAGPSRSYTPETRTQIPQQWEAFAPAMLSVPGRVGEMSYGVTWNVKNGCGFDYLTGVEVDGSGQLPAEYSTVQIPAQRYAVFTHTDHVSSIGQTIGTIWSSWVPSCELEIAQSPCLERYTPEFNPQTGTGGMEIWIPLKS